MMDIPTYVSLFRQSSPYIHAHRGKTFVITLSGEALLDDHCASLLADIALLQSLGIHVVLVHGARPQLDQRLLDADLDADFADDRRVTDAVTMALAKQAVGATRLNIEARLSMGLPNSPMHGAKIRVVGGNFIVAKPLGVLNGIDYLYSGEVRRVDSCGIQAQLQLGGIVLISPIGFSPTGEAFNLSYLDVATEVAVALTAEKLIFISTARGIFIEGTLQRSLSLPAVSEYLSSPNHVPDLEQALLTAAFRGCHGGVARAHLIGYGEDGALLSELFSRQGSGTLVIQDYSETIRAATIDDIGGILELIQPLENQGTLVKRSRERLETEISQFLVAFHPEGFIIGCAALYPLDASTGELACVATRTEFQARGTASRLLLALEDQARAMSIRNLFVLTTQAAHWFQEKGFLETTPDDLPNDKKSLYNYQRNSRILFKAL